MMPEVFEDFFGIFGKKTSDYYDLDRLRIHHKVFLDKGKSYLVSDNLKENLKMFESVEKGASYNLRRYLGECEFVYRAAMKDLVMLDYSDFLQIVNPKVFYYFFRFRLLSNLHSYVSGYFKNKDLQKILEFTTVFLGGSPYNTPAFYSLVSHADFNLGVFYPKGGMYQVVKALVSLCKEYGVNIITDCEVKKLVWLMV